METEQAVEHLQVIRTLMERSAVYRRALAPIMLWAGAVGIAAAAAGLAFRLESVRAFVALWFGAAVVALTGAFVIARRQALQEQEPFWSPPTRRVAQAISLPLTAGMILGVVFARAGEANTDALTLVWLLFYGCALNAAGFFTLRGMRLFGWVYIGWACVWLLLSELLGTRAYLNAHWLMGFFFGALHLLYGVYLYWTEKGKNAA